MTGERRAEQVDGDTRTRGFAEPHVEIEQRLEAEFAEQDTMARFG